MIRQNCYLLYKLKFSSSKQVNMLVSLNQLLSLRLQFDYADN